MPEINQDSEQTLFSRFRQPLRKLIQQSIIQFRILDGVNVIDRHETRVVDQPPRQLIQLVQKQKILFANDLGRPLQLRKRRVDDDLAQMASLASVSFI